MGHRVLVALVALEVLRQAVGIRWPSTDEEGTTPATSGFVFTGVGAGTCLSLLNAVTSVKTSGLYCRQLPETSVGHCKIAFVGDAAATGEIAKRCPKLFDVVSTADFSKCTIRGPRNMLKGLQVCIRALSRMPFRYNIQMDSNTLVLGREVDKLFEVLHKGYDLTAAFECCARHSSHGLSLAEDRLLHGWELQNGVLAYRDTAAVRDHARRAVEIYTSPSFPSDLTSGVQSAETQALAESKVRFLPLPPNFNLRPYTAVGYKAMPMAIAHWKYNNSDSVASVRKISRALVASFRQMFSGVLSELGS